MLRADSELEAIDAGFNYNAIKDACLRAMIMHLRLRGYPARVDHNADGDEVGIEMDTTSLRMRDDADAIQHQLTVLDGSDRLKWSVRAIYFAADNTVKMFARKDRVRNSDG